MGGIVVDAPPSLYINKNKNADSNRRQRWAGTRAMRRQQSQRITVSPRTTTNASLPSSNAATIFFFSSGGQPVQLRSGTTERGRGVSRGPWVENCNRGACHTLHLA